MGSIDNIKIGTNAKKVQFTISVDYAEYLMLHGHATNIHIFSEDCINIKTSILTKGKNSTKYVRIPYKLAKNIRANALTKVTRFDSKDKIIIITIIDR